jgi:hypothetical protein
VVFLILAILSAAAGDPSVDLARAEARDLWLHHPAIGDPSWDSFEREPGNPIFAGSDPLPWAVNGFLFRDPPSGRWFAFAGLYPRGYWSPRGGQKCRVLRERDGGGWEDLGDALAGEPKSFDGDGTNPGAVPDVSVVFDAGAYHMVYDWANPSNSRGGLAHARADRPEGPYRRDPAPIHDDARQAPILGRYVRAYGATLLRRERDWIVLHMMSTPGNAGGTWALAAMTAERPEGPYRGPTLLLFPQSGRFHPPIVEFYPAFAHGGFAYAPATSVAANRSFQAVFRAPLERAHEPAAWEAFALGSVWHDEAVPFEARGIWGQTFSGQVGPDGHLRAFFPSRTAGDRGAIGIASRPWAKPFRDGFVLSAPNGPSAAILRQDRDDFRLRAAVRSTGNWTVAWASRGPLGPDRTSADAVPDARMRTRRMELRRTGSGWSVSTIGEDGASMAIAKGEKAPPAGGREEVEIERRGPSARIVLGGVEAASIEGGDPGSGRIEVWAEAGTILAADRFEVEGRGRAGTERWISTEAIAGSGAAAEDWAPVRSDRFLFGSGHESRAAGASAKWSYRGRGFRLFAPRGPGYGKGIVAVDGDDAGEIDFAAPIPGPSEPVLARDLPDGLHAVALRPAAGRIPCDVLEILAPETPGISGMPPATSGSAALPGAPAKPVRSDWPRKYESLEGQEARSLLQGAIDFGRGKLGEPAIPVRTVHLRRSAPLEEKPELRRGFRLTEIVDSEKGVFAIYLDARPGDAAFIGQLAHEAFHLFNARMRDLYVEGLNSLLSQEYLKARGLPWESWLEHFRAGKEPVYGGAYFLVHELADEVGLEEIHGMLRHAVESSRDPDQMEIDIDRWLASLGPAKAARARAVIARRFDALDAVRRRDGSDLAFRKPREG